MNLFTYVKNHLPILDVVNHYTTVRKTGNYWKGCCPFHSEKTASFTVSPDKNIFYCFGCHVGGDVIAFVAKAENISPIQAVYHLAEQYSLTLPEQNEASFKNNDQHLNEKKQYWDLCGLVAQWCHGNLLKSSQAMSYFEQRGIDKNTISLFSLGYFPSGSRAIKSLLDFVKSHNYMAHDLLQVHIITESKGHLYSPFEERLLFPIKDHLGRFCGFGGRIFLPNDERSKYYNSKENPNFFKGSLMFGFDLAKTAIQKKKKRLFWWRGILIVLQWFSMVLSTLSQPWALHALLNI